MTQGGQALIALLAIDALQPLEYHLLAQSGSETCAILARRYVER
jgi:hypothetical protein